MRRKEIPPCTRECAASGRALEDGERIVAVLLPHETSAHEWTRKDFAADSFEKAPEGAVAWWSTQVPETPATAAATSDSLMELLLDTTVTAEARWDAAERLVRKRRVILERPDAKDAKGVWLAKICESGEHVSLPNPPVTSPFGQSGKGKPGGLLGGISHISLLFFVVFSGFGCASLNPLLKPTKDVKNPQPINDELPSAAQMVEYLNDNARRINAIQCNSVAIDCKQGNQNAPGLDGMVVLQKPNLFRLKAKVLGQNAVDLGSNQEEFWYWISKADPPYVFHCSHAAMAAGQVRMPFPFQPEMILAALGIAEYDPNKNYEVKANGQLAELRERVTSPQGKTVSRVTVFQRAPAQAGKPQVLGHILYDEAGKVICSVQVQDIQVVRQTGAVLPQKVVFQWPDQQVEMVMRFGEFVNTEITPDRSAALFSRRDLGSLPGFDLARWAPDEPAPGARGQNP